MSRVTPTPEILRAAARDAGNAHSRKHRRTCWNEDDFNVARETLDRLILESYQREGEDPEDCFFRFYEIAWPAR